MPSQLKQQLEAKLHNYGSSNTINLDPITYNSRYPGFDQANYRKLESKADNLGLTGYQREQFMDNLYQQVLPEVQKQIKNSDRRKYINDANYEVSQIQDKNAQIQAKSKLAVTEISQKLKEKYNIDPSTNDEQLFNDWIKSVPNGNQLFANYLNKGDTELLKKGGLGGDEVDNDSYAKIESKINGALKGDWGRLSTNGLKYVQGWKLILDATELAKAKGATGMNDGEIMRNVIKSSPKLQQKVAELQSLQNSLTEGDKSVLGGKTNGIEVGKAGFSLLPGVSLQFGDDTSMNIALVKDKPASYKEIQDLIDVKEKFGDNYVGEVGNVAKVFANQPIDTLKKKGNQTLNELDNIGTNMESFWNDIMPKQVVEAMQGRELTDEEFEQFKQSRADEYDARKNKNKEQVLKYNDKINKAFQKQVEMNLDPQIKEYYDDKTMTELLALGDMKGVGYKQAQMMASNWDMLPNIVVTAVNTPAGLTLMFGDSYARESQDSFERLMEAGADYDQASGISKVVGVINGAVEVGLDRLFGGVETTASKNLKNAFMNNLTEEATKKGFWEILGNIAKKQAGSSLEEGAEEVIQEIVGNAAQMTIKDNPEFADLFKGTWEAFEGGVFNPMNLMAGGSDIAANKGNIQQSLLDASYDAGVTARNIVDAGSNMQNNLREFMLDGAYNAGKGARNIVEWADKVKEFMSRKKNQNQTTNNVEVETTENSGIFDKVTDWGAEKITNTVSAQDKLYKAQEPRMNVLSNKKNLEKRRANSDRANQLIIQNGYIPTNTAERVDAHQKTINTLWDQVKQQINQGEGITVDQTPIINALEEYINEKKSLNIAGIESDISALEKELESLKRSQEEGGTDLPILENKKQVFNDLVDWKGQEASEVYKGGLKLISQEIGKIEDNLLAEIPGEFSNLKRDVGALLDTYEDVFKADMKNQRSKGVGLTEAYSRIEGMGDILDGVLGVFNGDGKKVITGLGKVALGKSLAKAKDVDFLVKTGFRDLAKQMGVEGDNNGGRTLNNEINESGAVKEMTPDEEYQQMVNRIMTPKEVETIVEMAWNANNLKDFYDGEYSNSLDWLKGEGSDQVEMYAENTFATQRMIESHPELLDGGTTFSEVLDAYLDGTLTGESEKSMQKIDLSSAEEYTPTKFYEPQELKNAEEVWAEANKKVTKSNKNEVYQARGDFVIDAHNPGFVQELGLTDAEVNKKLRDWAAYPAKAKELSNRINDGVAAPYRWAGLENSSIVKSITVSDADLEKMVKKVEGNSQEYERKYISNAMLALNTHIDWSPLTFEFVRGDALDRTDQQGRKHSVAGNYNEQTNTIRISRAGQNTVAHEMGHYLDYLRGRQLFGVNVTLSEGGGRNLEGLTEDQQKFVKHFDSFMMDLKLSGDSYNEYTMTPTEIFARFVGRFTEWTRNTATNDRFGYESKWYNDKFIEKDYIEFTKILQEKSKLDLANEYSNYQGYVDRNEQRKGTPKINEDMLKPLPDRIMKNVKIVGKWKDGGNIYEGVRGELAERLLLNTEEGMVRNAYTFRGEPVNLIWGEYDTADKLGKGLAKISEKHPSVLGKIQSLLNKLKVKEDSPERVILGDGNYKLVLRKDYDGEKMNWVLTAYEKE